MDALVTSSLIGAAAGLGGGLMSNSASAAAAKKQMQYQYHMSNTAYSRAVKDMRRAGLNPVLAAGSPASTPVGAMGQVQNLGDTMARGAATAIQARTAKAQVSHVEQQAAQSAIEREDKEVDLKLKKQAVKLAEQNPDTYQMLLKGMQQRIVGSGSMGVMIGQLADALAEGGLFGARKGNAAYDKIKNAVGRIPTSAKDLNNVVRKGYESMWSLMEEMNRKGMTKKEQIEDSARRVMREYRKGQR